jgi:hypothetical protein
VNRKLKRTISGLLGAAAAGVMLAAVTPGPASAHPVYQGQDFANHNYGGTSAWFCDRESDGNSVWGEYYTTLDSIRRSIRVDYGGDNCAYYSRQYPFEYLTDMRVVEIADDGTRYYSPWHGANFNN